MGALPLDLRVLVENARVGDIDAFTELVARFQNVAFASALAVLGDFHLAQDAAQEAFVAAYSNLVKLQKPDSFPGWLRAIVRHQCYRILRARTVQEVSLDEASGELHAPTMQGLGPDAAWERKETQALVLDAIAKLPQIEREITTLFYLREHSHKEIAFLLGLPATTVNNRLHSARGKLKRRIERTLVHTLKKHALPSDFAANVGRIVQVRGSVVDVEFDPEHLPPILSEVVARGGPAEVDLTVEVVQQLDRKVVRCLAMTPSRASAGGGTPPSSLDSAGLGRAARIVRSEHADHRYLSHRRHLAATDFVETGIKVIDLLCPLGRGSTVGLFGPHGAGKLVLLEELVRNIASEDLRFFTFVGAEDARAVQAIYERQPESLAALRAPVDSLFLISEATATADNRAALDLLDSVIYLSAEVAAAGIYPAVDPLASTSRLLSPQIVGLEHFEVATRVREALGTLEPRARKLSFFLSQPFVVAEPHTGRSGRRVSREQTVIGCRSILDGDYDGWDDRAFRFIGEVGEARVRTA